MKIALVKRHYSLRRGGSERYCVNLARRLKDRGHAVTVVGESIDDDLCQEVEFLPVPVNRATSWTNNRSFAVNCGRAVAGQRFDLVYGLGRAFGVDAVRVTERIQSHWLNVYYRQPMNRLQRWNPRHRTIIDLERSIFAAPSTRRIIVQSQLDRRLLSDHYQVDEDRIRTVYNGVDTGMFHPGVRESAGQVRRELGFDTGEPLLMFASMEFASKGLGSILRALSQTRHRDVRLVVLGSGPVAKFQRVARSLGVDRRVTFAGRKSDIQRYYGAADLFILPTAYEPFPNVNLEAMACGLPVVTTSTSGGADVIDPGRNGYLISHVHAVDEIAQSLDRHFALPETERERMRQFCWQTASRMTVDRNVQQTLDVFEEVLVEKFRV